MCRYRGPATVRAVRGATEFAVTVDLTWSGSPAPDARSGRLSGTVSPPPGAPAPPRGSVVLRLPDGYEAAGELAAVTSADGEPEWLAFATPAPAFAAAERGLDRHWMVYVGYTIGRMRRKERPEETAERVIARLGLRTHLNAGSLGWFCADLSDAEQEAVCRDIGVCDLQQVLVGHPAPCYETPPPDGVEGAYIVSVLDGIDPAQVAARLGFADSHVFTILNAFTIDNAGRADLDRIRYDPDVIQLDQDVVVQLDD